VQVHPAPALANDRLKILDDGNVRLEFIVMGTLEGFPTPPAMVRGEQSSPAPHACPWSDGTSSVDLAPLALIARLAALVPHPGGM
jgi:hypothetical protein